MGRSESEQTPYALLSLASLLARTCVWFGLICALAVLFEVFDFDLENAQFQTQYTLSLLSSRGEGSQVVRTVNMEAFS